MVNSKISNFKQPFEATNFHILTVSYDWFEEYLGT